MASKRPPKQSAKSVTFVALYVGETADSAKQVCVSADPGIVRRFAEALLADPHYSVEKEDPVLEALQGGRRRALELIASGEKGTSSE